MSATIDAQERARRLTDLIEDWDPNKHPVHCSNCRHCVVGGPAEEPTVSCEAAYSLKTRSLWSLIRTTEPRGFRVAAKCPGFDSMSDGNPPGPVPVTAV